MFEISRDVVVRQLGLAPLVDSKRPSLCLGHRRRRRVSHVAGGGDSEVDDMVVMVGDRDLLDVANIGEVVEWRCLAWTRSTLYEGCQIVSRSFPPSELVVLSVQESRAALLDVIGLFIGQIT